MMKLGLFIQGGGHHVAAWRHPTTPSGATQDFPHYIDLVRMAEAACLDMIFFADTVATFGPDDIDVWKRGHAASRLEPITLLSALAAVTSKIGLVSTASTSFIEPFHVARFFASLDKISNGRAGWNLVTSASDAEPFNFNREKHDPPAQRYARAEEFADVVMGLWRTWEDDAFPEDKQAGVFFDAAKMHLLNHAGENFKVRGPLTVRRSPQGHPVLVQAGQSEAGRALAARTAEVVFTVQQNISDSRSFRDDLRARARAFGRDPDSIKIMPGVVPVVGETKEQALAFFNELQSLIHPEQGVRVLSEMTGIDLSKFPVDGPMPDAPPHGRQEGRQRVILDMAKRENLTIRQVYQRAVGARAHRLVFGSPREIADDLQQWHEAGAADGFNIMPLTFPGSLQAFCTGVVPELQRRGMFRKAYEGATLREHLGLPYPHHPAASAKSAAAQ